MMISSGWLYSLVLVDDRGASGLKISAPVTTHGMYFPSTSLPSLLSLFLSEKDMVIWSKGEPANPSSPGRMAVKPACMCVTIIVVMLLLLLLLKRKCFKCRTVKI